MDPDFVLDAVQGGHIWALAWKFSGIFHGHVDNERAVSEVGDFLEMWSLIEESHAKLTKKDKERIKADAEAFGSHVVFSGFSGNHETEHLGIARFLVEKLDRFAIFKGRDLDSHAPLIEAYRRMYSLFEPMRARLIGRDLTAAEIIPLLKALVHPDNRAPANWMHDGIGTDNPQTADAAPETE